MEQAAQTLDFMGERDQGEARFLVGDMNADAEDDAITAITGRGFLDSYFEVHGLGGTAQHGNTSPVVLGTDNPAQDLRRRIDYVFAAEGERAVLTLDDSAVVMNEPRDDGLFPSDHLGVLTTVTLLPEPND